MGNVLKITMQKSNRGRKLDFLPLFFFHYAKSSIISHVYAIAFSPVSPPLFLHLCYVLVLSFVVDVVFFADLPILLPSVGLSPLLCVIIRLGVFRGSEAKKNRFSCCCWVVYIRKKGGRDFLSVPSALYLWLVISCAGMMLCCCVG